MSWTLLDILYLSGMVASWYYFLKVMCRDKRELEIGDILMMVFFSLLSWITVIIYIVSEMDRIMIKNPFYRGDKE